MKTKLFATVILCIFCGWNMEGQTQLWGTCTSGGNLGRGTIFSTDEKGNNFHAVYYFDSINGSIPLGSMTLANNGCFYGVTERGGFGDSCVVYKYNPKTGECTNIHDLAQFNNLGYSAQSNMIKATNGKLYGLCPAGGLNNRGVIYEVNPANDNYSDVFDFSMNDGASPTGSLLQAKDGNIYGYTNYGGTHNAGVIFKFKPSSNTYTKLYEFDTLPNGVNPPKGHLIQANNGLLYGIAEGGTNSKGVIFSYNVSSNQYSTVYNFVSNFGYIDKSALMQAIDGKLYATVSFKYAVSHGYIYSFDINTNTFTKLFDFDGPNGSHPFRGLKQDASGNLFGVTPIGGVDNQGVAFRYNFITNTYTKLIDFDAATIGSQPDCEFTMVNTKTDSIPFNSSLKVFPNPAVDYINIISSSQEETINFTDVLGRDLGNLKTNANSKTRYDISNFPNVFFVKSMDGVQKVIRK